VMYFGLTNSLATFQTTNEWDLPRPHHRGSHLCLS
jgi:hypothetical protein